MRISMTSLTGLFLLILPAVAIGACSAEPEPTATPTATPDGMVVRLVASRDATLFEDDDGDTANSIDANGNFAGKTNNNVLRRALVAFDLDGLPPGAEITAARLEIHVSRSISDDVPMTLHRVEKRWGEGTSDAGGQGGRGTGATPGDPTWIHSRYDTEAWRNPGGDFVIAPSATTMVGRVGDYAWESDGLLSDVLQWQANPATNQGWMIIGDEEKVRSAKRIASRENENPDFHPTLVLVLAN